MHSGLLLLSWLAAVALVQFVPAGALAGLALACLAIAALLAGARLKRLLRRTRFLLLAIFILFAWFTPGEAIFAGWPQASPTREGMVLAAEHLARLVAVVCSVAVLLERLPVDRLVGGLHALCRPLAWIGLPVERVALRLMLVLRYVESSAGDGRGDWRAWLLGDGDMQDCAAVRLTVEPIRLRELVFAAAALCGALLWWFA